MSVVSWSQLDSVSFPAGCEVEDEVPGGGELGVAHDVNGKKLLNDCFIPFFFEVGFLAEVQVSDVIGGI